MLTKQFALLLVLTIAVSAQTVPLADVDSSASPRLSALRQAVESGDHAAVSQFWKEIRKNHTPLVETIPGNHGSSWVTFLWQAKTATRNVVVFGSVETLDFANRQMTHLPGTDVWYKTYKFRNDARFTYSLSPNDSLEPLEKLNRKDLVAVMKRLATIQADPLNPQRFPGGPNGQASYVELPAAPPQTWITPVDHPPKGKVEEKKFRSTILNNERRVWIYTPPGFSSSGDRYSLLVTFDAGPYLAWVPVPVILDNLIAKKLIPPMVAILIDHPTPASRNLELPCHAPFADSLAQEIVPWMRENYHATSDAGRTVVAGSSYGGLAAAFVGLRHPKVFGNILSQSGSFWWKPEDEVEPEWLIKQYVTLPKLSLRLFVEVGLMEDGPNPVGPSQVVTNRRLRDALTAKGYAIKYQEFNGGHEYLSWRGSFADGLLFLMGDEKDRSPRK